MKKKYLFVVPSLSKGGAERVVSILASELVKRNRNAVIVTHFRTEKEYPINNDVEVVCLSNLNETEYREKMSAIYLIKLARKLRKEIVRQNPDYILPFLWTTCVRTDFALMGLSLKERVIQTVRNNPTVFPKNSVMKKYRNRLVQKSRLTIVQNKQQKQYFPEAQWEKIKVLPNPVSLELLQVQRCEDKSQFKVVGVGRLENQKNLWISKGGLQMYLITNGKVITRDSANPYYEDGGVVVEGNKIVEVGDDLTLKLKYPSAEIIDAEGNLIMPAFINTHTHIYSALARGLSINGYAPRNFYEVLDGMWWTIDRHLMMDGTRASATALYIDSIKQGVTTIFDHHASYGEIPGTLHTIAEESKRLGLRSCLCYEVSDRDGEEKCLQAIQENADFITECKKTRTV